MIKEANNQIRQSERGRRIKGIQEGIERVCHRTDLG
jgi:hypothetical protein